MRISFASTFRSFQNRNYQYFFGGQLISRIGMWMQRTAVVWLVYEMTHSTVMLGLTVFAEQFPSFILSPIGGIIADRFDRYKILMITQIISAFQALALAILFYTGHHELWSILTLSVILGIANAFDVPARQPMVHDIIDREEDVPNAIALNASLMNLARLIGPAISGYMLVHFGAGNSFMANAISFIGVIGSLILMKLPKFTRKERKPMGSELTDGLRYIFNSELIGNTLLLLALLCFVVIPYNTILPVYAREIFKGDAATFGYLNAFVGIGAVISTFYIASLPPGSNLKRLLWMNMIMLGIGLILFSHLHNFYLALVLCIFCGFGTMSVIPICNTIVQLGSAVEMRGRVMSYFAMAAFGMIPIGSLFVGWISSKIGVENTVMFQGITAILIVICFYKFLLDKKRTTSEDESVIEIEHP